MDNQVHSIVANAGTLSAVAESKSQLKALMAVLERTREFGVMPCSTW
jgi:hypothetical protein